MQETQVRLLGREDPLEKEMETHSSILAWRNPLDRGAWRATVHTVCKRVGHALMTGQQHEVSVTPLLSTLSQPLSPFRRAVLAESTSQAQGGHVLAKGGSKQAADLTWAPGCITEPAVYVSRYSCRCEARPAGPQRSRASCSPGGPDFHVEMGWGP